MVRASLSLIVVLMVGEASAQEFVPITIDAAKYQQIDDAMARISMPREAHVQWMQLWRQLEQQAVVDRAAAETKAKVDKK